MLRYIHLSLLFVCIVNLLSGCTPVSEENISDPLVHIAERMYASGNKETALSLYQKAYDAAAPEEQVQIALRLGGILLDAGDAEAACKVFHHTVQRNPNIDIKKNLARCYVQQGKADLAISTYQNLLEQEPNDASLHSSLGVAYILKQDFGAARTHLQTALAMNPNDENIQSNYGLFLALTGHGAEALNFLEPIGTRLGASPTQQHNLAVAYALSGDEQKARRLFLRDLPASVVEKNLSILKSADFKHLIPIEDEATSD